MSLGLREEELGLYSGFRVGNPGLVVSHLQCTYDTLMVVDPSLESL